MTIKSLKNLDQGIYQEAKAKNMSLTEYLQDKMFAGDFDPSYVRPDRTNSAGEKLNAFQQMLAQAGIRTKGDMASSTDAFFTDKANTILFPEFLSNAYRDYEGLPENMLRIADLVQFRTGGSGTVYKSTGLAAGQRAANERGRVSEGAEMPVYTLKTADRAIEAYKYGGVLEATYEALRRVQLPVLAAHIGKMAEIEMLRKVKMALAIALNGDGNANPAVNTNTAAATFAAIDISTMKVKANSVGASITIIAADETELLSLVSIPTVISDGSTAQAAAFRDTGEFPRLFGALLKQAPLGSVLDGSKKMLGFNPRRAGIEEYYENGSEIVESDKLITSQFERIAFSEVLGYAKPNPSSFHTRTHA